jgi:predicted AlkP superfamily phosphohydrolase/phosphomutase
MTASALRHGKKRLLFIGLDAGDATLIEQWCQAGLLPNIAQMRTRGMWTRMRTTAEIVHVSAWPSIFTGAPPDAHGLYHAYVMQPGQQSPVRPHPERSPVPFLWQLLSDQGKRCIIMDAFLTCPLQHFNGTQIVEWGSWTWFCEPTILPVALKKEMQKKFGPYPAENHSKVGMMPPPDPHGFHQRLMAGVAKKAQVVKWLMEREEWDLFLVVFGESHPAGHYFWHFHDPSYITHLHEETETLQWALRDVYVALDKAVGDILQSVDDNTTVFLVSGDGMGPNYSGSHILNDLLVRMGLFNNRQDGDQHAGNGQAHSPGHVPEAKVRVLSTIRHMIPPRVRYAIAMALLPRRVREKLSLHWKTADISWQHTRAFLIENANEGYVRLNLKGREPQGVVEPGKEYTDLCEEIYQTVKSMINPANGKLVAHTVYKTDEIYHGPCRDHMPDIIINWNDEARITTELLTEKYGLARSNVPGYAVMPYYTGNHRPNAFMLVVGPALPREQAREVSILDLAPTILTHFGIKPPAYMDGSALSGLFPPHRDHTDS